MAATADLLDLMLDSDGGGEAREEDAAGFEFVPDACDHPLEMFVVFGEMEDGVDDDEVEGLRGEGEVFDFFEAEFFRREVRDRLSFDVDGGDVVALTDQVVDVTAFAAAGVEDFHAGPDAATEHLID